ncbi:MAG: hypothetical protein WA102_00105 [Candidatus Methanoperedens sp.]
MKNNKKGSFLTFLVMIGILAIFSGCIDESTTMPTPTTTSIPTATPTPTLTATISTPTPTPTQLPTVIPTQTFTSTPSITITSPTEGDMVTWRYIVEGTSNGVYGSKLSFYVLIYPIEAGGPWWVQPMGDISPNGNWETTAYFGRDPANYPEDSGKHFKVSAIITSTKLTEGQQLEKIPDNLNRFDIKVVRK